MRDLATIFATRCDLHQSSPYARVMQQTNWHVYKNGPTHLYSRSLGPFSIAKVQRYLTLDPDWLKYFRKKNHTLTTFLEPGLGAAAPSGLTVEPYAHSKSALIDLSPHPNSLLNSFSQKTRYNITRNQKASKLTLTSTPLSHLTRDQKVDFFALHTHWSMRKNVLSYSRPLLEAVLSSFGTSGTLHYAFSLDHTLVACLLTLSHDSVATYYAAFCTDLGYKLYAPTLLTYQAMLTAKAGGCDLFDFGGIYDPRYPKLYKTWQGFTQFKAGFNPTAVLYPPTKLQIFW